MTLFQRIRRWWQNLPRCLKLTVMIVLGVLFLGRLALPTILKNYVNHRLSLQKNYGGTVGNITVHLWRGAYRIHDIHIYKTSGNIREPFFKAAYIDLSIEWLRLLNGKVVGQVYMMRPKVNFEDGPSPDQKQTGQGGGWGGLLSSLFPFDFNRLESSDGEVDFYNHYSNPPVDLYMNRLDLVATNLSNAENQLVELSAQIQATAKTFGGGVVDAQIKFSPIEKDPAFELAGTVNNIDLTAANDFMQAYAGLQVGKGTLSTYASVASQKGAYDGYLKLFFKNMHLFDWKKERRKDIFQIFKDAVAELATVVLTNPNGNFATKLSISGKYGKSQVDTWGAVASAINNAFFNALLPKFDEKITVKTVENKIIKKDAKPDEKKSAPAAAPLPTISLNTQTPVP